MPADDLTNDELTENIKIMATDDEKIKSFGEVFTNDSSREILQLLFNDDLTATQLAQKSDISLQLVKYHLNKLQDLGVVKISKIEKNSKSQDMKVYTASKFSIVIVPPKLSEKTKESKLLVRSFRHIYKVAGLGLATGLSGLLSLSQITKSNQVPINPSPNIDVSPTQSSMPMPESSDSIYSGATSESDSTLIVESASQMDSEDSVTLEEEALEVANTALSSDELVTAPSELFFPLAVITVILGGLTIYYLCKFLKKS